MEKRVKSIIQAVCKEYNVTTDEVCGKCRKRRIADARMMIAYLLFHRLNLTTVDIGRVFNRTLPTIYHAIYRIEEMLTFDKPTKLHYKNIELAIN